MGVFKFYFITLVVMALFQGCNNTISSSDTNDITIKSTNDQDNTGLQTLGVENVDIQKILVSEPWKKIKTNISAFYENSNYPVTSHSYIVDIIFAQKRVVAYADCQKVTAYYKIDGKEIIFSKVSIAPAIELATCIESEYADDAVVAFFENSFTLKRASEKYILFETDDFDTSIVLER